MIESQGKATTYLSGPLSTLVQPGNCGENFMSIHRQFEHMNIMMLHLLDKILIKEQFLLT